MKTRVKSSIPALAFLAFGAGNLAAHGEATLKSPSETVPAGAMIVLNGASFAPGEEHLLLLRGALSEYELGRAIAGPDSTFTVEIMVPVDARPGQYRIVALAPDGDEVATLDMPVLAATGGAAAPSHAAGGEGHGMAPEARADEIVIQRNRAGIEWGIIGLVIGLAGGLGAGLWRREVTG